MEDVDAQTLIKLVKFLKRDKAYTIHNDVIRLGTATSLVRSSSEAIFLFNSTRLHPNCMENSYPTYVTKA